MILLSILPEETGKEKQLKIQEIHLIQDNIKVIQKSISADIKQRDYILELHAKAKMSDENYTNEYIPHPADSARDIKILDARIASKQQKIITMQQEIAKILHKTGAIEILEQIEAA